MAPGQRWVSHVTTLVVYQYTGRSQSLQRCLLTNSVSTPVVTAEWGMACDLEIGVPSIAHNLTQATSFEHGIRSNINAGGDSCGRSILLGAILGACFERESTESIPDTWLSQLRDKQLIAANCQFLAS